GASTALSDTPREACHNASPPPREPSLAPHTPTPAFCAPTPASREPTPASHEPSLAPQMDVFEDVQGASCTTGGLFRGRAVGNFYNMGDRWEPTRVQVSGPLMGKVLIYDSRDAM